MRVLMVLEEFDGRDRSGLEALIADGLTPEERAIVCDLCHQRDGRVGRGAAWLVRTLLEKKQGDGLDLAKVFRTLEADDEWSTRFHVLQSVQFAPALALSHVDAIRRLLDDDRTALRVAALDAFAHLATVDASLMAAAKTRLMVGLEDPKASIRARTRHLIAMLDKHEARSQRKAKG